MNFDFMSMSSLPKLDYREFMQVQRDCNFIMANGRLH